MSNGTKNAISLIGNVGGEPSMHTFPDGSLKASFSLATSESWKDEGVKKEKTQWHSVVVFGKAAGIIKDYVGQGDKLGIEGQLEYRQYEDKDGVKRNVAEVAVRPYSGEVILLSPRQG